MKDYGQCPVCNNPLKRQQKYCSRKCYASIPKSDEFKEATSKRFKDKPKSDETKERMSQASKGKPKPWVAGENNPNYQGKAQAQPGVMEKLREGCKLRGQAWTEEHREQHSKLMLGPLNKMRGTKHSKETKQMISETKTQQYKDGLISLKPYNSSKAESEILAYLQARGVEVVHQYQIPGISFFYDFYLPEYNLIIEYNGDYWHANPNKYEQGTYLNIQGKGPILIDSIWERDNFKKRLAEDAGYKVVYIWESDYKVQGLTLLTNLESLV